MQNPIQTCKSTNQIIPDPGRSKHFQISRVQGRSSSKFKLKCISSNFKSCKPQLPAKTTNVSQQSSSRGFVHAPQEPNHTLPKALLAEFLTKQFRTSRKLRLAILRDYPLIGKIYYCNSKSQLVLILETLNRDWRKLLKLYLSRFFVFHAHIRKMKNRLEFMRFRQLFYEMLDSPEALKDYMGISNNIIKNFCKGVVNFIVIFFEQLRLWPVLKSSHRSI